MIIVVKSRRRIISNEIEKDDTENLEKDVVGVVYDNQFV